MNLPRTGYWDVMGFVYYYDISKHWGTFADGDFQALVSIANDISTKWQSKFRPEQVSGVGGTFSSNAAFLFLIVRSRKIMNIVETGVAQGVSSYAILKALQLNGGGKLISIDLPNRNPEGYTYKDGTHDATYTPSSLATGWLVPEELRRFWDLRLGRSQDLLPKIPGTIDMFYHDSEHSYENMMFEFDWAYDHLSDGAILASDDVGWNDAFDHFKAKHPDMKPLLQEFPSLLKARRPQ